jgi:hypothetical protein
MTNADSVLQALNVYLSFCPAPPSKNEVAAVVVRAAADILRNAYANEEHIDHPDDFLLDLANKLSPLRMDEQ